MNQNRKDILRKVENGEISLEVASDLLAHLEQDEYTESRAKIQESLNEPEFNQPKAENFKRPGWSVIFWLILLIFGIILTIFSSTWLYQNYEATGLGFKFWLTWIPFLIGVFFIYLGWILQKSRWIHVNIKQPKGKSPQRIFIALPLPTQLLGFFLKIFKGKMPSGVSNLNIEELIQNIDQQIKKDEPLFVDVNDEDGTKVEIYIG